ncbi:MAG TPA: TlpA disulfide reductase family protein [Gemmatimonadales bacterium]|nr:TlpA disulfide reductase family protein [Gemmatimonadales bacterium]
MRKQWGMVLAIVAGLLLGAAALVRFGPKIEGVEVGKRAPDYRAVRLGTQDSVSLHQEAGGKVTLINIWATWCIPCRAEMPAIEKLYRELGPKGLRVLAVSIDEGNAADVQSFVQELGLSFEILHDQSGEIQRVYQTTGVPESFLLDKNGVIVKKVIGEHPWSSPSNQRIIADLLGGD